MPTKKYRVSSISIDKHGTYWVDYVGDVPEQGGLTFGAGTVGFKDLDSATAFMSLMIEKHLLQYKEIIEKKEVT